MKTCTKCGKELKGMCLLSPNADETLRELCLECADKYIKGELK